MFRIDYFSFFCLFDGDTWLTVVHMKKAYIRRNFSARILAEFLIVGVRNWPSFFSRNINNSINSLLWLCVEAHIMYIYMCVQVCENVYNESFLRFEKNAFE